jgi:ATP-dependent DNA helicase RecG
MGGKLRNRKTIVTLNLIKEILKQGEGLHCEFKKASSSLPNNLFETICAFLNTDGGYIFLGVNDDGCVLGVSSSAVQHLKNNLVNLSNNPQKLDPSYLLSPEEFDIDGKTIIIIQVPVSSQLHKTSGQVYLRREDGDYCVRGTHQLAGVINRKLGLFTEQRAFAHFSIDDLQPELFDKAKRLMMMHNTHHPWARLQPEELLNIAGFYTIDSETGKRCLSLAAILMFGSDQLIQSVAPAYAFDCLLRRESVDRYDDRNQIRTNLIDAYDLMMNFVEKHLNDPFYLEGTQRISLRDKIFREAVSNIIAHREYLHGSPGRLIIYKDKVILDNPCVFHYTGVITAENLVPSARNPVICQFMMQLGRFDRLGSGVININKYLPFYANGAKPIFQETNNGFELTIPLVGVSEDVFTPEVTPEVGVHDVVHDVVHEVVYELNTTEQKILEFLLKPKSTPELLTRLGYKTKTRNYEMAIKKILKYALVEMTIPDKPRSKNQRYRLTQKGRNILTHKFKN